MSLALTWDMMLRTGQLSYGTAGLFGLGAYASALLVAKAGVNPLVSIAAGGSVCRPPGIFPGICRAQAEEDLFFHHNAGVNHGVFPL
jgi:ABC-type branched-subunit amino acid transport system permease subunit